MHESTLNKMQQNNDVVSRCGGNYLEKAINFMQSSIRETLINDYPTDDEIIDRMVTLYHVKLMNMTRDELREEYDNETRG